MYYRETDTDSVDLENDMLASPPRPYMYISPDVQQVSHTLKNVLNKAKLFFLFYPFYFYSCKNTLWMFWRNSI